MLVTELLFWMVYEVTSLSGATRSVVLFESNFLTAWETQGQYSCNLRLLNKVIFQVTHPKLLWYTVRENTERFGCKLSVGIMMYKPILWVCNSKWSGGEVRRWAGCYVSDVCHKKKLLVVLGCQILKIFCFPDIIGVIEHWKPWVLWSSVSF